MTFNKIKMAQKYSEAYNAAYNLLSKEKKEIINLINKNTILCRADREWYNDWILKIIKSAEDAYEREDKPKAKEIKIK
jgi:hypothetical protein